MEISDFSKLLINGKKQSVKTGKGHLEELKWFKKQLQVGSDNQNGSTKDPFAAAWVSLKANELISEK